MQINPYSPSGDVETFEPVWKRRLLRAMELKVTLPFVFGGILGFVFGVCFRVGSTHPIREVFTFSGVMAVGFFALFSLIASLAYIPKNVSFMPFLRLASGVVFGGVSVYLDPLVRRALEGFPELRSSGLTTLVLTLLAGCLVSAVMQCALVHRMKEKGWENGHPQDAGSAPPADS